MGAYSVGLLPQALQRPDSTHLAWVGAIPFGLLPVAIAELLRARRTSLRGASRPMIAAAAPAVLLIVFVPHFTFGPYGDMVAQTFDRHREVYVMHNEGRSFYYGRRDAAEAVNAMLPVVDQIAQPGDKLFVGTGDLRKTPYSEAFLYYLLPQTRPGTRYIEMDPAVANRNDSGLADDLASSDLVILSSIRDDWVEPNASLDVGSDEPNQVLHRDFCMVGSWGKGLFGHGLYELYQRCDRQYARRPPQIVSARSCARWWSCRPTRKPPTSPSFCSGSAPPRRMSTSSSSTTTAPMARPNSRKR